MMETMIGKEIGMSTDFKVYLRELQSTSGIGAYIVLSAAMKDLSTSEYKLLCKYVKD